MKLKGYNYLNLRFVLGLYMLFWVLITKFISCEETYLWKGIYFSNAMSLVFYLWFEEKYVDIYMMKP